MSSELFSAVHESRRKRIAACIASVFCLAAPAATLAATVTSCLDDGGGGTLRSLVTGAAEGATIDFAGLDCSGTSNTITLVGSSISIGQNSLTLDATGAVHPLTIDASTLPRSYADSRIFSHSGSGTLTIDKLVLTGGYVYHRYFPSFGGCLSSAGNVALNSVTVTNCETDNLGSSYIPVGGAIFVNGSLTLTRSIVSDSTIIGAASGSGGGVYVKGNLSVKYSTIAGNKVTAPTDGAGGGAFVVGGITTKYSTISGNSAATRAGGVLVTGNATFLATTISGNSADFFAGIDAFSDTPAGNKFQLGNSTVSGNTATGAVGGIYVNSGKVYFYNSTIAFNNAPTVAGVDVNSTDGAIAVELQSTLMSNNSDGSSDNDFYIAVSNPITINGGDVVTPANNLIRSTNAPLPNGTKVSCPLLGPLRNNGGLTQTHALGSTSKAIDAGNTVGTGGGAGNYDQRGSATANGVKNYIRESAPVGSVDPPVADIGAYEVQQDDDIFDAYFDGCNSLI